MQINAGWVGMKSGNLFSRMVSCFTFQLNGCLSPDSMRIFLQEESLALNFSHDDLRRIFRVGLRSRKGTRTKTMRNFFNTIKHENNQEDCLKIMNILIINFRVLINPAGLPFSGVFSSVGQSVGISQV